MRSFVTFLSLLTLLFFMVPVLCLGMGGVQGDSSGNVPDGLCLPQTVSCNGERVNTPDLLVGILAELNIQGYRSEALKAAAVAVTTQMAVVYRETGAVDGFAYKTPEEAKEQWGDYWFSQYWPQLQQGVTEVWGQVLTEDGAVFAEGLVFPLSWGKTEAGAECPFDFTANNYETVVEISLEELGRVFPQYSSSLTVKKAQSGRVETVTSGNTVLTGEQTAERFGLTSPAFSITVGEDSARFVCLGQGKGVGMSLYAANEMAKRGSSYKEILAYFYPQATLAR